MRVAVDTNVLVRAVMRDDPLQASAAARVLADAELIAVALPCLCEFPAPRIHPAFARVDIR